MRSDFAEGEPRSGALSDTTTSRSLPPRVQRSTHRLQHSINCSKRLPIQLQHSELSAATTTRARTCHHQAPGTSSPEMLFLNVPNPPPRSAAETPAAQTAAKTQASVGAQRTVKAHHAKTSINSDISSFDILSSPSKSSAKNAACRAWRTCTRCFSPASVPGVAGMLVQRG